MPYISVRRLGLALLIAVPSNTLTFSFEAQFDQQAENASSEDENQDDCTAEPPPVKWELLEFYFIQGERPRSRRIRRVKVTLLDKQTAPWGRSFVGDKELIYEIEEPHVLEALEVFLWRPLRMAAPDGAHGARGDGSSASIGTIRIYTNHGESFPIGISTVGFILNNDSADVQNVFYSWGLAHFLDDLCAKRAGNRIPPLVMKELTGEARFESDRRAFPPIKRQLESEGTGIQRKEAP
jgi:hypothetical protein